MTAARRTGVALLLLAALPAAWLAIASLVFLAGTGLWGHPSIPRASYPWQWLVYRPWFGRNGLVTAWLAAGALVGAVPAALALQWAGGARRRSRALHGTSAFATRREAERGGVVYARRPPGDAVILGKGLGALGGPRYLCLPGNSHVSLSAMTEAGKGVGFVVPNCLSWSGSLIAFDVKGELFRKTAGHRERMGQEVFCFAPGTADGRSHRYNPYQIVRRDDPAECIEMLHRVNHILIPPNPQTREPYFDNAARDAVNGISVLLALTPGEPLHPGAVRAAAIRPDYREHLRGYIRWARAAGRPMPKSAVEGVLAWVDDPDDRGRNSIQRTIQTHLALWGSPKVVAATEASDFDLRAVRKRPVSVYLWLRPTEMRRFRPLTATLFQQLIDLNIDVEFGQDPEHRCKVLMMMDEFWAMGRMDVLADAASFVRAHGIRMAYVVQTKAQLVSIYGREGSENIFENTKAEIVFGVKGVKAAREFSEMAGDDTVVETSRSRPRFLGWLNPSRQTESDAARRRALLLPQEVQRLPADREIIYRPNALPLMARRIVYHEDRLFRGLEVEPPPVPALAVDVPREDVAALAAEERRRAEAAIAARRAAAEREAGDARRAAAAAAATAASRADAEAVATEKARAAAARAAGAQEAARLARGEATAAANAAREAAAALAKAEAKGGDGAAERARSGEAKTRAERAAETARSLSSAAAVAAEEARGAKQAAAAAGREARSARNRAEGITQAAVEAVGQARAGAKVGRGAPP